MSAALTATVAVMIDAVSGEPRRAHPLVAFGRAARAIERGLHADRRRAGVVAWTVAVAPPVLVTFWLLRWAGQYSPWCAHAMSAVALYLAIGRRSLREHAQPVADALAAGDLDGARRAVSRIVSRDTGALDGSQVAAAATESVLENGNDAVFGALFWFAVLGAPGVVLYRLANTLDAMWGYRTARYARFGWAAARIDDLLNWVPARLTAATYVLLGDTARAWRCWRQQAPHWDSPNAGPVMAAGAGAIGVRLGGAAPYHGIPRERPLLGEGRPADVAGIRHALALVDRGVALWLAVGLLAAGLWRFA